MEEGQPHNEPGWVFKPGDTTPTPTPSVAAIDTEPGTEESSPEPSAHQDSVDEGAIKWTASEYLANPKTMGWFALLGVGSIVLAIITWILTGGDVVSTAVIPILGFTVGVFAARQPRTLPYILDSHGLTIGQKFYPYTVFKSFSIGNEYAIGFISLLPLKRFMPPLVIHIAPEDEERITEKLADYLPYEDHKNDIINNFTHRLRF